MGYGVVSQLFGIKTCGAGNFVETCFVVYFPRDAAFDIALGIAAADDVAVVGINGKAFGLDRRGGRAPRVRKILTCGNRTTPPVTFRL
ncbi:hypothetical protein [Neisseria mucosa]|uniref:hypothetical protein n=1 Tax=Neisseria mucosa TaxID=488 RepID=UPI001FD07949|nr:hypothetical protein [Neisseria mucosa]